MSNRQFSNHKNLNFTNYLSVKGQLLASYFPVPYFYFLHFSRQQPNDHSERCRMSNRQFSKHKKLNFTNYLSVKGQLLASSFPVTYFYFLHFSRQQPNDHSERCRMSNRQFSKHKKLNFTNYLSLKGQLLVCEFPVTHFYFLHFARQQPDDQSERCRIVQQIVLKA